MTVRELIEKECKSISDLLCKKNDAYGNSAFEPINIFSKLEAIEQLNVRIDDKLNRIAKGQNTELVTEDTEQDLIGYLILKRAYKKYMGVK
jgi:hypothetical protein